MYNPIYNKRTINQPLQYLIDLDWFASWSLTAPRWLCKKVWIFGGATISCNRLKYLELHHETRRTTADLHKNQRLWLIIWLVVWNMLYFSISYMGCHPSHWRTHIFQRGRYTNNQMMFDHVSSRRTCQRTGWICAPATMLRACPLRSVGIGPMCAACWVNSATSLKFAQVWKNLSSPPQWKSR